MTENCGKTLHVRERKDPTVVYCVERNEWLKYGMGSLERLQWLSKQKVSKAYPV